MLIPASTDLTGKVCLVTGAAGGIGLSTIEHFKKLGAVVYATDKHKSFSGSAVYKEFDLLDEKELSSCLDWIAEIKPDVLFNNAAIFDMGSVIDASLVSFDRLFGINVRAFYAIMQAASKSMIAEKKLGSIINVASQAGHRGEALVAQ